MRLAEDLTRADEPPITLFKGSDAPWIRPIGKDKASYVTDGPFLYRSHTGALLMLWSSVGAGDYTLGLARSTSGAITGPWTQDPAHALRSQWRTRHALSLLRRRSALEPDTNRTRGRMNGQSSS